MVWSLNTKAYDLLWMLWFDKKSIPMDIYWGGYINFSCWQGQKPIKMKVPIINYIKSEGCPIPLSSFLFFYVEVFNIISFGTDVLVYYIGIPMFVAQDSGGYELHTYAIMKVNCEVPLFCNKLYSLFDCDWPRWENLAQAWSWMDGHKELKVTKTKISDVTFCAPSVY